MARTMTVGELIERLQDYPEDAQVRIMGQPSWPFEHALSGVVSREDLHEHRGEGDDEDASDERDNLGWRDSVVAPPNRVFLVEGDQLRYGLKAAWDAV